MALIVIRVSALVLVSALVAAPTRATEGPMQETVKLESRYAFEETLQRLRSLLDKHGFTVFAWIDQQHAARSVGLEMQPTVVVIYGNPRGGTPLMVAAPDFAIELPLRVVVRAEPGGSAFVLYKPASALEGRHGLPPGMAARLSAAETLIGDAAGAVP